MKPQLHLTEVKWKCAICATTFPDHDALIEHLITHFKDILTQYPYSVQEEIIRRLISDI